MNTKKDQLSADFLQTVIINKQAFIQLSLNQFNSKVCVLLSCQFLYDSVWVQLVCVH